MCGVCRGSERPFSQQSTHVTGRGYCIEVRIVHFHYLTVDWKLVEVRRVRFDYSKVCIKLVEVGVVRFDYHKASRRLVEVLRIRFDCIKEVGRVFFD